MKYIDKSSVPIPNILTTRGVEETKKNTAKYKANKAKYTSDTPATRTTKSILSQIHLILMKNLWA